MLTHTDFHYLAAILIQISSPWGVEIDLGELVEDIAGEEGRDVDITIRYRLRDNSLIELHGIEVKDERRPLDIAHVEQIVQKLKDMPALTKHALVSSSGFTEPAKRKARYHGLELYHLRDWDGKGLLVDMSQCSPMQILTMGWESVQAIPILDGATGQLTFDLQDFIHDPANPEAKRTLGQLLDFVCDAAMNDVRSKLGTPAENSEEEKRIEVNKPVNFETAFSTLVNGKPEYIKTIVVQGVLVQKKLPSRHARKVLIRDDDNCPVAGCMVSELPDGSLWSFLASSTEGSLTARIISVTDRGKTKIYKEKMQSIAATGPASLSPN